MSTDIQCEKFLRHDFSNVKTREVLLDWEDYTYRLRDFIRKNEEENENEIYSSTTTEGYWRLSDSMINSLVEFLEKQLESAGFEPYEIEDELNKLKCAVEEKNTLDSIPECPVHTEIVITFL